MANHSKALTKTSLQKILGIKVKNLRLYEAALTHPSYLNENQAKTGEDFDRLEFLGDSILNEVVCQRLFKEFPEADEGMMSKLRSILVSRKILSRIAVDLKLRGMLRVGKSLREAMKTPFKNKILADTFEALLAAVYFDQGRKTVTQFILDHFEGYFNPARLFRLDPNPKSTLQEFTLKHWQKLPEYHHHFSPKGVKTTVTAGKTRTATATAKTKKESEIKAARNLLAALRQAAQKKKIKKTGA